MNGQSIGSSKPQVGMPQKPETIQILIWWYLVILILSNTFPRVVPIVPTKPPCSPLGSSLLCDLIMVPVLHLFPIEHNRYFNQTRKNPSSGFQWLSQSSGQPVKVMYPQKNWNGFQEQFFRSAIYLGCQYPNALILDVKLSGCVLTICTGKAGRCNCNGSSSPKLFYLRRTNWFCPV